MSSGPSAAVGGTVRPEWFVVDATDKVLGRLATRIASILAGKHRPDYLPYRDVGDFVVVTNASKVRLTGRKMDQKEYRRHTGYPGGLKSVPAREMSAKYPERIIEEAVRGMLPKSRLGRKQFKKLKVYGGPAHPHEAQKPRELATPARRTARTN